MAYTIEFQGESTVALDATLAHIAPGGGSWIGRWFVELLLNDCNGDAERTVQGWVAEFIPGEPGRFPQVVVKMAEDRDGIPVETGTLETISTNHIAHLTVP